VSRAAQRNSFQCSTERHSIKCVSGRAGRGLLGAPGGAGRSQSPSGQCVCATTFRRGPRVSSPLPPERGGEGCGQRPRLPQKPAERKRGSGGRAAGRIGRRARPEFLKEREVVTLCASSAAFRAPRSRTWRDAGGREAAVGRAVGAILGGGGALGAISGGGWGRLEPFGGGTPSSGVLRGIRSPSPRDGSAAAARPPPRAATQTPPPTAVADQTVGENSVGAVTGRLSRFRAGQTMCCEKAWYARWASRTRSAT